MLLCTSNCHENRNNKEDTDQMPIIVRDKKERNYIIISHNISDNG